MPEISIVAPVFQSQECLNELYRRLAATLSKITEDFEILLIEDGSRDRSWNEICGLAQKDRRVRGLRFTRNFGQHYGISAGLDHARGDWVVVMDCDLQDRPEDIEALYREATKGFDIVLALRNRDQESFLKRTSAHLFYKLLGFLTGVPYDSRVGNFRIMSRQAVDSFLTFKEHLRFFGALVNWMGFPTSGIEVEHDQRPFGKGAYNFSRMFHLASDTIIAYSDKPLKLSVGFGLLTVLFSAAFAGFVIYRHFVLNTAVTGWSSLIVVICFFSGIIVLNLGIIGIYLGKIFAETKRRPLYLIRERVNFG